MPITPSAGCPVLTQFGRDIRRRDVLRDVVGLEDWHAVVVGPANRTAGSSLPKFPCRGACAPSAIRAWWRSRVGAASLPLK